MPGSISDAGGAFSRASGPHYILDQLLSIVPTLSSEEALSTCVQLVTIVGQRAISVSHLKKIFRFLHSDGAGTGAATLHTRGERPSYEALLLEALHGMTAGNVGVSSRADGASPEDCGATWALSMGAESLLLFPRR